MRRSEYAVVRITWPLLVGLIVSINGCGSKQPEVVEISGTVTRNGTPIAGLQLNFEPVQGRPSWGATDENGRYTLSYTRDQDGARVGTHKVWVIYNPRPKDPKEEMLMMSRNWKPPADMAAITEKYGSAEVSPLEVEVKEEGQVIDFALD